MQPTEKQINSIVASLLELPQDYAIIEGQMDRYWRAAEGHKLWAMVARTCVDFYENIQWTQEELEVLKEEGRPVVTINKIRPLVNLIEGYFRQNRYDIRFMPGFDGSGVQSVADTLNALAKQTGEMNQSNWKDAEVFSDGIKTGRGFTDVRLGFEYNLMGDVVEMAEDPFSILVDPEAETYDPNDRSGGWGFFIKNRWLTPLEIYLLYGEKGSESILNDWAGIPIDGIPYDYFNIDALGPDKYFGLQETLSSRYDYRMGMYASPEHHINRNRKLVRVLDCQHKQLKKVRFFVNLETGEETEVPDTATNEQIARTIEWAKMRGDLAITMREGLKRRIRWTVTAGDRVLYDEWSPYGRYTIVPYFAYFRRGKTQGMVEPLLDAQREINKRRAAWLHVIMTCANSGWIYEEGALNDDMQAALEEMGSRPGINIEYKSGFQPPRKIEPSNVPVNIRQAEMDSTSDIKEIANVNDSALGQLDVVQSGRAVQARQKQSMVGNEALFDNFARTRELKGRNYLHIYQRYYTEERIIRIRGDNGKTEEYFANKIDAAGQIVNNLALGTYEVAIDETPVSATFAEGQMMLAKDLRDSGIPIPDDIMVDLSDLPRKEEIKQRLEEDRLVQVNKAQLENMQIRGGMGIPTEAPLPPVTVPEGSFINRVVANPPQMAPMPPAPAQMQPQVTVQPPGGLPLPLQQ